MEWTRRFSAGRISGVSIGRRRAGWLVVSCATLGLGCQTLPGPHGPYDTRRSAGPYPNPSRVAQGALVGSLAGAAIGAGVDHHDRGRGALVGAVGGLLAGALLGGELERYEEAHWRPPHPQHHHGGFSYHDDGHYDPERYHDPEDCDVHGHADPYCHGEHAWQGEIGDPDDGRHAWDDDVGYADHGRHAWEAPEPPLVPVASDVLFDPDSAALSRGAKARLRRVAERVRRDADLELLLRGHADGIEGGGDRFGLSEQRARAVRAFLAQEGVPMRRIAWVGFGDAQPVASNRTPEGRQRNRRVEVVLREPA